MEEISYDFAKYLFNGNQKTIYLLYSDGTEAEAQNIQEIDEHQGLLGIETEV